MAFPLCSYANAVNMSSSLYGVIPFRRTSSLYGLYIASLPPAPAAGSDGVSKMCAVLAAVSRHAALQGHQVQSLELADGPLFFVSSFSLVLFLQTAAARPRPTAAAASQAQNTRDRLEWGVPPFFAAARDRGKKPPTNPAVGNPPDQLSTISLLLLVDPEVTDIERRAIETSL